MKKSGHEMGLLTDSEYDKFNALFGDLGDVICFELDGVVFVGEKTEVVKRYIKLKPAKSFYVWCHDNLPILTKSTGNIK